MRARLFLGLWAAYLLLVLVGGRPSPAAEPDPDETMVRDAKIATEGPALLDFFRLRTLKDADRDKIHALIRKLGDDDFGVRGQASTDPVGRGPQAVALLRQATVNPDVEIARRAETCLERIDKKHATPSVAVSSAVARLVGKRKPAGAADVLLAY